MIKCPMKLTFAHHPSLVVRSTKYHVFLACRNMSGTNDSPRSRVRILGRAEKRGCRGDTGTLDTDSDGCWIIRLETRQHTYLTLETQQKTVIIAPKHCTESPAPSARLLRSPVLICVCISCGGARPAARLKPCAGSTEAGV